LRTGKVKFANTVKKKRKKKEPKQLTIITACDQCGKLLRRTCVRTQGSYAVSRGVVPALIVGDDVHYFCSDECKEAYLESL